MGPLKGAHENVYIYKSRITRYTSSEKFIVCLNRKSHQKKEIVILDNLEVLIDHKISVGPSFYNKLIVPFLIFFLIHLLII